MYRCNIAHAYIVHQIMAGINLNYPSIMKSIPCYPKHFPVMKRNLPLSAILILACVYVYLSASTISSNDQSLSNCAATTCQGRLCVTSTLHFTQLFNLLIVPSTPSVRKPQFHQAYISRIVKNINTPIYQNLTIKRGCRNTTKLLGGVERSLCRSFTIVVANSSFRNVATIQTASIVDLLIFFRRGWWIVKLALKVRSTTTSNFAPLKIPHFIVKS